MNPLQVKNGAPADNQDAHDTKASPSSAIERIANDLISVIVVSYNGVDVIEPCLASLVAQTFPQVEIIVVDNASQDDTVSLVRERFPGVTLIENESNLGFASANNVGIAHAHGYCIALLNQDAWATPHWLEEMAKVFAEQPSTGMCAAKVLYSGEPERINSTGVLLYRDLATVNRGLDELDRGQYDAVEEVFGPYGAAAAFRRELLDEVGGLDDRYYLMHEEDDLAWRARFVGWRCTYVPSAIVFHQRSASLGIHSPTKLYYGERNRIWNLVKYLPWWRIPLAAAFTILRYAKMLRLQLAGGSGTDAGRNNGGALSAARGLMRAWIDGIAGVPQALRQRRVIWQAKRVPTGEINRWMKTFRAPLSEITEE